MKKRLVVYMMATVLCTAFGIAGCGQSAQKGQTAAAVTPASDSPTDSTETGTEVNVDEEIQQGTTEVQTSDGTSLDVEHLSKEQSAMLAVMDSLNMCMEENTCEYEPENPDFFWKALYYTVGNYPDIRDNRSSGLLVENQEEACYEVDSRLLREYATGLFEDYSDLLELPADSVVTQGSDDSYYKLPLGDRGLSNGKIVSWVQNADGTNLVETQLIDPSDNTIIADYKYTLVVNPYAQAVSAPLFTYTVRSVEKVQN